GGGPISTASSASRTKGRSRSASEWTATTARPRLRQVRRIRLAISPRFAINIFLSAMLHLNGTIMVTFNIPKAFRIGQQQTLPKRHTILFIRQIFRMSCRKSGFQITEANLVELTPPIKYNDIKPIQSGKGSKNSWTNQRLND